MIISYSEIKIILNELCARGNNEITLRSLFSEKEIFNYNLKAKKLSSKTARHLWKNQNKTLAEKYSLSETAQKELPEFDDIKKAVVSAGLLVPAGIDDLINEIKRYLEPRRLNRRRRFLIGLDTNQLVDNLMSSYIEQEFSSTEYQQMRNFLNYVLSSWVLYERDCFIRNERNKGLVELNNKLRDLGFYLPEKIDKKARLGYSIYSELKALEESYIQLDSKKEGEEKYAIRKNKNLKDQAIIEEYEEYLRSLKDIKFIYLTSDDQSFALAKDRFESIKIKVENNLPQELSCDIEQATKLIYQLALFLGVIKINKHGIRFNIYYKGKEHIDWENKKLEFLCSDKTFEKRISTLISTVRELNTLLKN